MPTARPGARPARRLPLWPAVLAGLLAASIGLATLAAGRASAQPPPAAPEKPEEAAPVVRLPQIDVIGATPLPALGTPIDKYPGNVQSLQAEDLQNQNSLELSDALYRRLGAVNIAGNQSNPWQSDVTYRGFLASPLAGSPIGLSVYLDGMRFNDGFGDTVNWDLIPQSAIAGIDVIPGSNPIFGLNTLGGALAVRTKNGRDFPGTRLRVSGGSFGRRAVEAEHGGAHGPLDWYVALNALDEDGWRDQSPSELRQAFAKVGLETERITLGATYAFAKNDLIGNGVAPERTLDRDRRAVHTFPDQTRNEMHLAVLHGAVRPTEGLLVSANAFYRRFERHTLNGDAEVACVDDATGSAVFGPDGRPLHLGRCAGSAVGFFDEDGNALAGALQRQAEAEERTTHTVAHDGGATVQVAHKGRLFGHGNQVTAGVAYDRHHARFVQREAEGAFAPRGHSVGVRRTAPYETETDVATVQENVGVYVTDTLDVTERLALTLAARYQHVRISIRDRSGDSPALDGDHRFWRINPAAGATFRVGPGLTLFTAYSEGFRAPTAAELACADRNAPCNLPNAFVADPPLNPVIARTYEVGARGRLPVGAGLQWSAGLFRTDLEDDILFTVVETGGAGFFQNVGATRRQGAEVAVTGEWKGLQLFASYAFVEATYQSAETLASVTAPAGSKVTAGDRLPGIPPHNLKVGVEYPVLRNLWLGAHVIAASGSHLRGDDGNRLGKTHGYTVLSLHARYEPVKQVEVWARIDNVTDAEYVTGGVLNFNALASPIGVERFVAPGPPLAVWGGVKLKF